MGGRRVSRVLSRLLPGIALVAASSVVASGLSPSPARVEASPPDTQRVRAADSVVRVPHRPVRPGRTGGTTETGLDEERLAQARPAQVEWPQGGRATVDVPARAGRSPVGSTAVAVTAPPPGPRSAAAGSPPDRVTVAAYGPEVARRLGGHGTAFRLSRADDDESENTVGVQVDVSGFADAFGGDFESRLRLVAKPSCAMTTPQHPECGTSTPVESHVDLTRHVLVADVPVGPSESGSPDDAGTYFVVAAAPSGETGSATATKLSSSSKWSVGLQSGDFSWTLPVPQVPALAGDGPGVELSYSSQAVDGMVAAENNQPSWVGMGWDTALPFIERRYRSCVDDGGDTGDLCWAGDHLRISLEGTSAALVRDPDANGDVWRAQQDPGWRVQRFRGADNGDDDGEYWVVTTPEGTRYTFGRGTQATTGTATRSTYTVPVFGDDDSEPCHEGSLEDSWCTQAWRWNLDRVVDAHGNSSTYFYTPETNRYARNGDPDKSTEYVRGGHLGSIVYSQRSGDEEVQAPARLLFSTQRRCIEGADGSGECPSFDEDNATSYPDVPMDSLCTDRCTGEEQKSPTFYTEVLLRSVTAQRSGAGGGWVDVDRMDFTYAYPQPSDGTSASLWLEKVQQTGLAGSGSATLPAVEFTGTELANRADPDSAAGAPEMRKLRITSFVDELGRRVDVRYGQPNPCPIDNLPTGRFDRNTQDCFPGWRTNGEDSGFGVWHKYLVTGVTVRDTGGGGPPQTTQYRYRGTPAWHFDDDPVTPIERESWSDWRAYGSVDVVAMSDPDFRGEQSARPLSVTRSLFFRGMDGDRTADGGRKDVEVTDSQGTSLTDLPWLRGKEREQRQFALDGTGEPAYELGGTLHAYEVAHRTPAEPGETNDDEDAHLVVESESTKRETVIAEDGSRSTRTTQLETTYDTYGQPTSVLDVAGSGRRCTRTWYARDASTVDRWMLTFPYRVRTYEGTCDAPTALITGKDQYYDGSSELGGPVSRGDVTSTGSAVRASGANTVADTVTTEAAFDAYGRTVREVDGNGNASRTAYDPPTDRPATVTETNPLGHAEVTTLDADRQQPVAVRDANGQITRNTYDPLGRLVAVQQPEQGADDPPAQRFSYHLDPDHRVPPLVVSRQLQLGDQYVTTWQFLDSLGRDRQTQEVSPASTSEEPQAVVTDIRYDDAGNVAAESLPVVVAGAAGDELVDVPADLVVETRRSYDELNREVRASHNAQGRELWDTTTTYLGDHTRVRPPPGGAVTTSWTDARGRLIRQQEGVGSAEVTTRYAYTAADQIASVTDPAGHRSTYTYDLLERRTESNDADAGSSRTRYDANGNAVATWDAEAVAAGSDAPTLSTDYDSLNRPLARWEGASGSGRRIATLRYDSASVENGVGRLASQTTHRHGKDYTVAVTGYDPRGRVEERRWTFPGALGGLLGDKTFTTRYGYDAADHLVRQQYVDPVLGTPGETIRTGYDALGNPRTLTSTSTRPIGGTKQHTYVSDTRYAADGKIAGRDYANPHHPLRRAYAYEPDTQRLSRIQTVVDGLLGGPQARQDDAYHWNPSGNLTRIVDHALHEPVATCFTYDGLDRLTHAWTTERTDCSDSGSTLTHDGPAGFNTSWTYTPDGNMASVRSLHHTKHYEYDDPDHPHAATRVGHERFGYDANGAMHKRAEGLLGLGSSVYEWDAQHQLQSVTKLLDSTRFVYAPDGTRLARIGPTGTATLYIDGQELRVLAGVVEVAARFYRIADTTVGVRCLGLLTWQLNDVQGSAQIAVPAGTSLVKRTYYDPYGEIRPGSAPPPSDRGWLGQVHDSSTGLNQLGARYYDATLGRFLSTDPAFDSSSAQTANPYSYGANNPVRYIDPIGLWSLSGAWNSVKNAASSTWDWAKENKGLIADVAVGIGVGIAVGAVCATGVGCLIVAGVAAGAAGAAAGYGVDAAEGKTDFSWGGLAGRVGLGAVSGLAGAGIGKAIGAGVRAAGGSAAGKSLAEGAKAVKGAVAAGARAAVNAAKAAGQKVADAGRQAARSVAGKVKDVFKKGPTQAYDRAAHYGGAATGSAAGRGIRAAAAGQTCPSCSRPMVTGTPTAPVPEHSPPLVEHYYEHGGWKMSPEQARAYARSAEAFDGAMCRACQSAQGGTLSKYSQEMKRRFGLE